MTGSAKDHVSEEGSVEARVESGDLPVITTREEVTKKGTEKEVEKEEKRPPRKVKVAQDTKIIKQRTEARKTRPQSAPPKEPVVELGGFSKSLKLVGVDIPSIRTEATRVKSRDIQVKTKEPTFKTRILRRSGSYADLTKQINKDMKKSEFESVKSDLNRAIFEEWYFKKLEDERERKAKIKEEEEKKAKEEEERKKEIAEQSKVRDSISISFANYFLNRRSSKSGKGKRAH